MFPSPDVKPVWYLDVDGVLNAVTWSPPAGYESGEADGFTMQWNPRVIEMLNLLLKSERVDVVWLTTWCEDANKYIVPLMGIDHELPVISGQDVDLGSWWKWNRLRELHDPERTGVWTDDELNLEKDATNWAKENSLLPISPDAHRGLTVNDMIVISRHFNLAVS